jgi:hypothetical protein
MHTGIVSAHLAATLRQENEPRRQDLESELDALIDKMCLDDPMTADSYLSLEGELIIEECVSAFDEESKEEDDEESDDDEEESVLTHRKALQVDSQLLTYASFHDI